MTSNPSLNRIKQLVEKIYDQLCEGHQLTLQFETAQEVNNFRTYLSKHKTFMDEMGFEADKPSMLKTVISVSEEGAAGTFYLVDKPSNDLLYRIATQLNLPAPKPAIPASATALTITGEEKELDLDAIFGQSADTASD